MMIRPSPVEGNVLGQKLVCADNDIDGAIFHALDGLVDLFLGTEAGQFRYTDRHVCKPVAEGLCMLFGQQGCRRQQGNLFAPHDGDKGRPQGDFSFAEADVTANQPVHRLVGRHVFHDGSDGGSLIGRFLETETVGESFVIVFRQRERESLAHGTSGVQIQQLGGCIVNLLGSFLLGFFPLA